MKGKNKIKKNHFNKLTTKFYNKIKTYINKKK